MGKRGLLVFLACLGAQAADVRLYDIHDRLVNRDGVTLNDWDGYVANPAYRLRIYGPETSVKEDYPISVRLFTKDSMVQFSGPNAVANASGSETLITLDAPDTPTDVELIAWPDRDSKSSRSELIVVSRNQKSEDTQQRLPLIILDRDNAPTAPQPIVRATRSYPFLQAPSQADTVPPTPFATAATALQTPANFNILLDLSNDESGFFDDAVATATARQALDDWAYFIDRMDFDPVEIGEERTPRVGFTGNFSSWESEATIVGSFKNQQPFKDLLVYLTASRTPSSRRAGTGVAQDQRQKKGYQSHQLPRSAHILLGLSHPGFDPTLDDHRWFASTARSVSSNPKDLYSYVCHEMGHALGIDAGHSQAAAWAKSGKVTSLLLEYYLGRQASISPELHLVAGASETAEIDPVSGMPGFGGGEGRFGVAPRWLITKLDLQLLRALGYPLRAWAVQPVVIKDAKFEPLSANKAFEFTFKATGGVNLYDWRVQAGSLPPGLSLNRSTGSLSGTPSQTGIYRFVISAKDGAVQSPQSDMRAFSLIVQ